MTKEKCNKILNKVTLIILGIIIIISGIYIGSPLKEPIYILFVIINIWTIIYITIKKFLKEKNIVIKNRIDIIVMTFAIVNVIPILFNSYTTLEGTVNNVILYETLFALYILVRNTVKSKKQILFISISLIIATLFPIIFGIDMITTNIFQGILEQINSVSVEQSRLASTFGYPNALAIYISTGVISSIYLFLNIKNRYIKPLVASYLFLAFFTILLTFSRATMIILGILIIIYLIILKDKKKSSEAILLIISSLIAGIIYYYLFNYLTNLENYIVAWKFLAIAIVFAYIINLYMNMLSLYIENIKMKYSIILVTVIIILAIIYIIIGFKLPSELVLFKNTSKASNKSKDIYGLETSTNYNFEFDIETDPDIDSDNIYKIEIIERNRYYAETVIGETTFGRYNGIKNINVTTSDDMEKLFIKFYKLQSDYYSKLTIKQLKINNQTENLNYKILPEKLVYILQNMNFTNKSIDERLNFMNDSLKLIKDNWLLGIGGDGWYYRYEEVQEFLYSAREPHCYPLQIFLENGIIGIFLYLLMIITTIASFIKRKEKGEITKGIFIIFLLLVIHSIMDFELSFICVIMVLFICIAILNEKKERYNKSNINDYIAILMCLAISIFSIRIMIAKQEENKSLKIINTKTDYETVISQYEKIIRFNPINKNYKIRIIRYIQNYIELDPKNEEYNNKYKYYLKKLKRDEPYYSRMTVQRMLIESYINDINDENKTKNLKQIKNIIEEIKYNKEPVELNIKNILNRTKSIKEITELLNSKYNEKGYEELKEYSEELEELLINEKESNIYNVQNYKKNKENKYMIGIYLKQLEEIYK